ncbi:MAG: hypothetical protein ACKOZW_13795, partial [Cyanobium sp.]
VKVINGNSGGPMMPLTQALVGGWPWLPLLPFGMVQAWRQRQQPAGRWVLGLGAMALLLVLPLKTQLPWYSLLLWPPFCLACGPVLADLAAGRGRPSRSRVLSAIWLGLGGLLLAAAAVAILLPGQPIAPMGVLSAAPAALGLLAGGWWLRRSARGWNAQGAIALVAGGWLLSLGCLFASPLWNWELGNAAPIAPALGLASAGSGASKVWLLERDSESQRPSLHWYLDSPATPLAEESSRWPGDRFRVLARIAPEQAAAGGRCRIAQAGSGGWKSWECRARGEAS